MALLDNIKKLASSVTENGKNLLNRVVKKENNTEETTQDSELLESESIQVDTENSEKLQNTDSVEKDHDSDENESSTDSADTFEGYEIFEDFDETEMPNLDNFFGDDEQDILDNKSSIEKEKKYSQEDEMSEEGEISDISDVKNFDSEDPEDSGTEDSDTEDFDMEDFNMEDFGLESLDTEEAGIDLSNFVDESELRPDDFEDIFENENKEETENEDDVFGGLSEDEIKRFEEMQSQLNSEIETDSSLVNKVEAGGATVDDELRMLMAKDKEAANLNLDDDNFSNFVENESSYGESNTDSDNPMPDLDIFGLYDPETDVQTDFEEEGNFEESFEKYFGESNEEGSSEGDEEELKKPKKDKKDKEAIKNAIANLISKFFGNQKKSTVIIFCCIAGALFIGIIGVTGFLISIRSQISEYNRLMQESENPDDELDEESERISPVYAVIQPQSPMNNARFVFLSATEMFEGSELTLSKLLIDDHETVFYFNRSFDHNTYRFSLYGDKDIYYPPDLFELAVGLAPISLRSPIRFQALPTRNVAMRLVIENIESGEQVEYKFRVVNGIVSIPYKHYQGQFTTKLDSGEAEVWIDDAIFASDVSVINFSIRPSENKSVELVQDPDIPIEVTLTEGAFTVLPRTSESKIYTFENSGITLGTMNFNPLRSLSGRAYFTIKNLYNHISLDLNIPAEGLFENRGAEREIRFGVGELNIVLEGMQRQGSHYVLVAHAIDPTLYNEEEGKYSDRVEVRLETELVVYSQSGERFVLTGNCRSGPIGSDVLFDIGDIRTELRNASTSEMELIIKSVNFNAKDIVIPINLDTYQRPASVGLFNAKEDILEAFEQRLEYKSGNVDIESLRPHFSTNILSDRDIMSFYTPVEDVSEDLIKKSVQLRSCIIDKDMAYAIVMDMWYEEGSPEVFYNLHNVTARQTENGYVIVYDNIVEK